MTESHLAPYAWTVSEHAFLAEASEMGEVGRFTDADGKHDYDRLYDYLEATIGPLPDNTTDPLMKLIRKAYKTWT